MAIKYGVQLYSVRTELMRDPLRVLRQLYDMGYHSVEGFGEISYSASEVNYALSDSGLKIAGYHTPWSAVSDEKLPATIRYFKAVGNDYVIIPGLPKECTETIDAWKKTAERFNVLAKQLKDEGMTIGYHNHAMEFKPIDGQLPFEIFFDNTDPSIVMQMDNGNAMSGGGDVMAMMKRYPGRAKSVHLKPYSNKTGFNTMIGEDDVDWKAFMAFCKEQGGTERYVVEYECEEAYPQMKGVELCIKALKDKEAQGEI